MSEVTASTGKVQQPIAPVPGQPVNKPPKAAAKSAAPAGAPPAVSPPVSATPSITTLIQAVIEAPDRENGLALLRRSLEIFKAAFIEQVPDEGALELWEELKAALSEAGLTARQEISALLILEDERLSQSDRVMLYNFYSSQLNSSAGITPGTKARIIECYRESSLEYNGWQGANYRTTSDLFLDFFMAYLGNGDYLAFFSQVLNEDVNGRPALFSVLTTLPPAQAQRYLAEGLSPGQEQRLFEELFYNWQFALREWQNAPTGSDLKVLAYQRLQDWGAIAQARGWLLDLYFADFQLSLPGLTQDEYHDLFLTQFYGQEYYQSGYLEILNRFVSKYQASGANSERHEALARVIDMLASSASQFGVSGLTLENILSPIMVPATRTINDLEALASLGQDRVVAPEGLPQEIKDLLIATGYWELVRNNLLQIRFTKEINEGQGAFNMEAGGYALTSLAQVVIDYIGPDGNLTPIWDIAATLVHEAAHVAWQKLVVQKTDVSVEPYLLSSLPHERQAAIVERNFLMAYLKNKHTSLSKEEQELLEHLIVWKAEMVAAANAVLGYERSNLDPNNLNLPSAKVLEARGLGQALDLDLQTYISYQVLGAMNSEEAIDQLLAEEIYVPEGVSALYSDEDLSQAAQLLKEVLKGEGYLESQFTGNLEGLQITMRYHNGTKCMVPENVALVINYLLQGTSDYAILLSSEYGSNIDGKIRIQFRSTDLLQYLFYRD